MHSDGFDRYVGLWEMMLAAGVPDAEIHAHIDGLIERLETRMRDLERRGEDKHRELVEIERTLEELRASDLGRRVHIR